MCDHSPPLLWGHAHILVLYSPLLRGQSIKVLIDYPFEKPIEIILIADTLGGITRRAFFCSVQTEYMDIFDQEVSVSHSMRQGMCSDCGVRLLLACGHHTQRPHGGTHTMRTLHLNVEVS